MKFYVFLLFVLFNFIACEEDEISTVPVTFQYKSNASLDCSSLGENVNYYQQKENQSEVLIDPKTNHHAKIIDNILILSDLRGEEIKSKYTCKLDSKVLKSFQVMIAPYIFKPEKPSQTVTAGGNAILRCVVLYGNETESVEWTWKKNDTALSDSDKYKIVSSSSETVLNLTNVQEVDRGEYECALQNKYGVHSEKIQVRVKDPLAALWPFLAIVAEVVILCFIILIYEKKCSKKPTNTEEENEQSQNLMGRDDNADLKKRQTKA